ncbi:MOSC domain-containing protein [Thermoflavimicrobium daqui]|uniref:MOSC domain-containing protein n=1 Tax=Thermoflavimicrobium daqui TaxID=2137476 RepID=A0A364K2S8_9BACL|nr:MOSC domain-containing protein [Thermoflavimicrobium daqui]RAL22728.1 MOSC domain-containing protein [Thermoflavimicrobium daqui]
MIADQTESFVTRRLEEADLTYGGIPGDRHFGITARADTRQPMYPKDTEIFNRRQISILSVEELDVIAKELGVKAILPEWLGANLLISGLSNLTQLTMGSRLLFPSGAGLVCMGENRPCRFPGEVIQKNLPMVPELEKKFVRAAYKKRGIVCLVERPGTIKPGDQIKILVNDFANPLQ